MVKIIKKISKGTRFNQIYLKQNEGMGFNPGEHVIISPLSERIEKNVNTYEYNIKLNILKKDIVKNIFKIIGKNCTYSNIIITGSFLDEGYNFEDIDIIILDPKNVCSEKIERLIIDYTGICPHIIHMSLTEFKNGIKTDPLFLLMIDRFVSIKRMILRKQKKPNYRLLDAYLIKNKNLIDGYDDYNIKQRKKILRDFISIKLFSKNKEVTHFGIDREIDKIFGKKAIEKLFLYGNNELKKEFIRKYRQEFNKLEKKIIENAAEQTRNN